jgi:DNA polymerase elongation subunit (family B)
MNKTKEKGKPPPPNRPSILFLDLESSIATAATWGNGLYQQNLIKMLQHSFLLSFAYQWADETTIHCKALPDYKEYKKSKENDLFLVEDLWELLDQADIVIGHNVSRFDCRKANARLLFHNLPPPSPYKELDTLRICRKYFQLSSNKLTDVCEFLNLETKMQHEGIDLWFKAIAGDKQAWRTMVQYNKQDVKIVKSLYNKIKSWVKNHPDLSRYFNNYPICKVCLSYDVESRGWDYNRRKPHRRIHCNSCGHWSTL